MNREEIVKDFLESRGKIPDYDKGMTDALVTIAHETGEDTLREAVEKTDPRDDGQFRLSIWRAIIQYRDDIRD